MTKEELQMASFEIIAAAGDAFSNFYQAVEEARKFNFETAEELVEAGQKSLNAAHNAQTEMLTAEARGDDMELGVILIHGQDHLMTAILYERIAKQLIEICREMKNLQDKLDEN